MKKHAALQSTDVEAHTRFVLRQWVPEGMFVFPRIFPHGS